MAALSPSPFCWTPVPVNSTDLASFANYMKKVLPEIIRNIFYREAQCTKNLYFEDGSSASGSCVCDKEECITTNARIGDLRELIEEYHPGLPEICHENLKAFLNALLAKENPNLDQYFADLYKNGPHIEFYIMKQLEATFNSENFVEAIITDKVEVSTFQSVFENVMNKLYNHFILSGTTFHYKILDRCVIMRNTDYLGSYPMRNVEDRTIKAILKKSGLIDGFLDAFVTSSGAERIKRILLDMFDEMLENNVPTFPTSIDCFPTNLTTLHMYNEYVPSRTTPHDENPGLFNLERNPGLVKRQLTPDEFVERFKKQKLYETIASCLQTLFPNKDDLIVSTDDSHRFRNAVIDAIYS
jgi:hypothetical protein